MEISEFIVNYIDRSQGWIDMAEMLSAAKNELTAWKPDEKLLKQHLHKALHGDYGLLREEVKQRINLDLPLPDYASSGVQHIDELQYTKKVEKFLRENEGHKILFNRANRAAGKKQFIDIFSLKEEDRTLFFTEVKGGTDTHKLQTGIGQLLYHRFAIDNLVSRSTVLEGYIIKYQLVFPRKFERDEHFTDGLVRFLESKTQIILRFI